MGEFKIDNRIHFDVQECSARTFAERKQQDLKERLQQFREADKTQIISATEGKLKKTNRKQALKLTSIQQKRVRYHLIHPYWLQG